VCCGNLGGCNGSGVGGSAEAVEGVAVVRVDGERGGVEAVGGFGVAGGERVLGFREQDVEAGLVEGDGELRVVGALAESSLKIADGGGVVVLAGADPAHAREGAGVVGVAGEDGEEAGLVLLDLCGVFGG